MKVFATLSLFSAAVLAGWTPSYGYGGDSGVHPSPEPVLAHSTVVVHETSTVWAHETPAPDPVHEMPMEHPPAHDAPAPGYELEVGAPAEGPKTHTVIVGGDAGLVYVPPYLSAAPGDIVHFVFHKQNHSVTQSTFDKPCNRLETGEDSGLLPNPNNTITPAPTWDYVVKDEKPTWWYCKQRTGTHCGKGMVFAINPTAEKTFNQFKETAIKINGTDAGTPVAPADPTATPPTGTVTLIGGEPTDAPADVPSQPPKLEAPYTAPGWNQKGDPNACNCACFCGVGSFPKGDGIGNYGGIGGSLTAPW